MYIDIAQLAAFLGVPTAVTGLFFWLLKRRIDKREDERAETERARKKLDVALIKGVNAAIALSEATAKAVQRIPDAHCNGVRPLDELRDMSEALHYASEVKHSQKDFLVKQGVEHLHDINRRRSQC